MFTGTAEAGSTVTLFVDNSPISTTVANSDGSFSLTSSELADNNYGITFTATDRAGLESDISASTSIQIDTTFPNIPSITTTTTATNDITPTIEGTAEAGSTVELFNGDTSLGTATAESDGSFSITTGELADDDYSLTVTATDAAGNTSSASTALALTIDTAAPEAPVITTTTDLTNDPNPVIQGTAEAGSTVTLLSGDTSLGTATADANGAFSITSSELADNSYTLTVKSTDAAGNESAESAGLEI